MILRMAALCINRATRFRDTFTPRSRNSSAIRATVARDCRTETDSGCVPVECHLTTDLVLVAWHQPDACANNSIHCCSPSVLYTSSQPQRRTAGNWLACSAINRNISPVRRRGRPWRRCRLPFLVYRAGRRSLKLSVFELFL